MISLLSGLPAITEHGAAPSIIVFDIETGALPLASIEHLMPEFEAPSNYKDPDKIAAYKDERREAWIEKAALSPVTGRVLAIGVYIDDEHRSMISLDDEAEVIRWFWNLIGSSTMLVGFCSHRFDLPFLVRRSWALGVDVPAGFVGRYFRNSIDLIERWQMGARDETISLDRLAKFLGVGQKTGDGAYFHQLLKMDPVAAEDYLRNDIELTVRCAAKLGVIDVEDTWAPVGDSTAVTAQPEADY